MGFPRQAHWSGLPLASSGALPAQGSNPQLLHQQQIRRCRAGGHAPCCWVLLHESRWNSAPYSIPPDAYSSAIFSLSFFLIKYFPLLPSPRSVTFSHDFCHLIQCSCVFLRDHFIYRRLVSTVALSGPTLGDLSLQDALECSLLIDEPCSALGKMTHLYSPLLFILKNSWVLSPPCIHPLLPPWSSPDFIPTVYLSPFL